MNNLGDVEITLKDKPHVLRCSLRAAQTVSALSGGFSGAFEGIARYNMSTYAAIVASGLNKRTGAELSEVEEMVYETGLESLTSPLSKYVARLMSGGRDPVKVEDGTSGKE